MKNKFHLLFTLSLTLLCCGSVQSQIGSSSDIKKAEEVNVFDDFEDQSTLKNWNGPVFLSNEFPAKGKSCLKLNASEDQSLWLESEKIPKNWSGFDYLKFDIYNPSSRLYCGSIQIFDEQGTDEGAEFHGQSYNGEKIFVNTGWNHYEFLLRTAMVEGGDRLLALDRIRKLRFFFGSIGHALYLDNFRLVSGLEGSQTASKINPSDCQVIIDNRYVYPSLVGPGEMLKTSPQIIQLRQQATAAVEKLKSQISIAEMQGYQSLYQRIPLITAEVGLGIRSKLVWFQNEEEEAKILKHVIKSCSESAHEIEVILSAHRSNIFINEPENDVSYLSKYQSFDVPPYPALNELKPKDGFYRDKSGNPVIIFSMLQLNKGPMMDYFGLSTIALKVTQLAVVPDMILRVPRFIKPSTNIPARSGWVGMAGADT